MKRIGNLFEKIITRENLLWAELRAAKGKKWQDNIKTFEHRLDWNVDRIIEELKTRAYQPQPYRIKKIYEPKARDIFVAPFRDRVVQHALMNVLAPIWEERFIEDSYACRDGKGVHAGSKRTMEYVRRNRYCLKCDISKFYPSMNHEVLLGIIKQKIKCPETLWLVETIVKSPGGDANVPIGNYTSQWFGNLYMNEMDQRAKHVYKCRDYLRYCDDFLFFSDDKEYLKRIAADLPVWLGSSLKLRLSKCDLFPVSRGVDFLGYRHFRGYILVRKSTAKRAKKRLKRIRILYGKGRVSKESYRSTLASTRGWLQWANAHHLRRALQIDEQLEAINK